MDKAKFVRLDMTRTWHAADGEVKTHKWTEWFCKDTTWTNPYNRKDALAEEFQNWCKGQVEEMMQKWDRFGYLCCPNITIGGAPLHDGWGSDIDGRICDPFGKENVLAWGDKVEEALLTGEVQTLRLDNGDEVLETTFTPFETITPDPDSVAAFEGYAAAALEGLVTGKEA